MSTHGWHRSDKGDNHTRKMSARGKRGKKRLAGQKSPRYQCSAADIPVTIQNKKTKVLGLR